MVAHKQAPLLSCLATYALSLSADQNVIEDRRENLGSVLMLSHYNVN